MVKPPPPYTHRRLWPPASSTRPGIPAGDGRHPRDPGRRPEGRRQREIVWSTCTPIPRPTSDQAWGDALSAGAAAPRLASREPLRFRRCRARRSAAHGRNTALLFCRFGKPGAKISIVPSLRAAARRAMGDTGRVSEPPQVAGPPGDQPAGQQARLSQSNRGESRARPARGIQPDRRARRSPASRSDRSARRPPNGRQGDGPAGRLVRRLVSFLGSGGMHGRGGRSSG